MGLDVSAILRPTFRIPNQLALGAGVFEGPIYHVKNSFSASTGFMFAAVRVTRAGAGAPTTVLQWRDSWDGVNFGGHITTASVAGTGELVAGADGGYGPFLQWRLTIAGTTPDVDVSAWINGVGFTHLRDLTVVGQI